MYCPALFISGGSTWLVRNVYRPLVCACSMAVQLHADGTWRQVMAMAPLLRVNTDPSPNLMATVMCGRTKPAGTGSTGGRRWAKMGALGVSTRSICDGVFFCTRVTSRFQRDDVTLSCRRAMG
jgi:hypothetical protein